MIDKIGKTIKLGPMDAAIVFRNDGTFEATMPEIEGEYIPEHILTSAAVLFALQDPDLYAFLHNSFLNDCGEISANNANDD